MYIDQYFILKCFINYTFQEKNIIKCIRRRKNVNIGAFYYTLNICLAYQIRTHKRQNSNNIELNLPRIYNDVRLAIRDDICSPRSS